MWGFFVGRAGVEIMSKGWGTTHSFIKLNQQGLDIIKPFLPKFIAHYTQMVEQGKTENQMFYETEKKFRDFLIEKICIPHNVSNGACVVMILQACKDSAEGRLKGD